MAMKPWLLQTPSEFLSKYNTTPAEFERQLEEKHALYTKLTIWVFVFYRGGILLKRQADTWTIPILQFTTGGPDNPSDNYRPRILERIVDHLDQTNFPQTMTHELQFMEFSIPEPSIVAFPSTDLNKPSELLIMAVLTTSNPALEHGIAHWNQALIPQDINFRWVNKGNVADIPLSTATTKRLSADHFRSAWERLIVCSTQRLPDRVPDHGWPILCTAMLEGVLLTRGIVTNTTVPETGVVAVSQGQEKRYLALIPMTQQEYDANPVGNLTRLGQEDLTVVGRWKDMEFDGMNTFRAWPSVMDLTGRLREGMGWDWE
ncbi:hypothetical protein PRZ48_008389 [Zasmidium cellare]|uniref:Uncharacterized protein n=1 Tax=Zasmidium cellare TaxID=395010 RepID=A0ABR0EGG1_ZASCE|nr:hypothetical protein PRZ48_008389 [Zasmidium cellare]